jgi:hypothetical protein
MQDPQIARILAELAVQGTDAARIGDLFLATWTDIHNSLSTVIGVHGSEALYRHCVARATARSAWLASIEPGAGLADPASLAALMCQQKAEDAAEGAGAVLDTLTLVLFQMLGTSLTHELLGSAWRTILEGRTSLRDDS